MVKQVHVPNKTIRNWKKNYFQPYLSIIREDNSRAVGLASPFPGEKSASLCQKEHVTDQQCRERSHGQPRRLMHPVIIVSAVWTQINERDAHAQCCRRE